MATGFEQLIFDAQHKLFALMRLALAEAVDVVGQQLNGRGQVVNLFPQFLEFSAILFGYLPSASRPA